MSSAMDRPGVQGSVYFQPIGVQVYESHSIGLPLSLINFFEFQAEESVRGNMAPGLCCRVMEKMVQR